MGRGPLRTTSSTSRTFQTRSASSSLISFASSISWSPLAMRCRREDRDRWLDGIVPVSIMGHASMVPREETTQCRCSCKSCAVNHTLLTDPFTEHRERFDTFAGLDYAFTAGSDLSDRFSPILNRPSQSGRCSGEPGKPGRAFPDKTGLPGSTIKANHL